MNPYKDPATGKYQVRWRQKVGNKEIRPKRTFATRKAATKFIENLQAERRKDHDAAQRTFNDYADDYLAAAQGRCKAKTYRSYEDGLKNARTFLGDRQVGTLRATDARAFLAYLQERHAGNKVRSIRGEWRTFAAVLKMVVDDEALPSNPADKVDLPTANSTGEKRFNHCYLTPAQVEMLASQLPTPYDLLIRFAAYTGLRRGEIAGLDIRHIELIPTPTGDGWRGYVHVERTAGRIKGEWVFDTPKSTKSTRKVPLPPWLAELLAGYIEARPNLAPDSPLFPGRHNGGAHHGTIDYATRLEPESFCRNVFTKAVRAALPQHVRFHDLRH